MTSEDNGVVDSDGSSGGSKGDGATSITQLAHREQRGGCKVGNDVNVAGSGWEHGEIQFGFMRGDHDAAVWVVNSDGLQGGAFVEDRGINGAKVGSTSCVGNCVVGRGKWRGGRTYRIGIFRCHSRR